MAATSGSGGEVNARVVYWGIEGCGKSSNLRAVYAKLRPDHRSEVREVPTRFDPSVSYEVLPIELGEIAGVRTRLQIIAVPGPRDQAPTRKQLLDRVDGVVLVLDATPERLDENVASFEELRRALAAYGRRPDQLPLVVQYNKRDLADPYAMEALHRKLELASAPVFEAVATEGTGVLETLSTISKRVIRSLRDREIETAREPEPSPAAPGAPEARQRPQPPRAPEPAPHASRRMEAALLEEPDDAEGEAAALEVETALETPAWEDLAAELELADGLRLGPELTIVSVGSATRVGERKVRVPLELGDGSGRTGRVALVIEIDPLLDEDP
jgi:signal recognition particle receptor subunit beta